METVTISLESYQKLKNLELNMEQEFQARYKTKFNELLIFQKQSEAKVKAAENKINAYRESYKKEANILKSQYNKSKLKKDFEKMCASHALEKSKRIELENKIKALKDIL
jgi:hypothetical protein